VRHGLHPGQFVDRVGQAGRGVGQQCEADAVDELSWMQVVPRRFYSCRLRATKPEPAAYGGVLAELGAGPAEVTFVDDRPANVAGAAVVGMRALLFTDPTTLAADLGVEPP